MPREQVFHQGINLLVLAARKLAILIEREVPRSANFSCLSESGISLLQDLIQRLTLNFCGHGAKFYNAAQASQWYQGTSARPHSVISLFLFLPRASRVFSAPSRPFCALPKDQWRLLVSETSLSLLFPLCRNEVCPAFLDAWRFSRSCLQLYHISFSILFSLASHTLLRVGL